MSKKIYLKPDDQSGQILGLVVIITALILVTVLVLIGASQLYFQSSSYSVEAEEAIALAEAGVDKAVASLNKTGGSYSGDSEIILGGGSFSVNVTSIDAATKMIEATGYLPNKSKTRVKRKVKVKITRGTGVAFVYGIQVGEGGLELGNDNLVIGSLYSNGSVKGKNNNQVTGDIWIASAPQAFPDQSNDCEGLNCQDFLFGKNTGGDAVLDVAQSFVPSLSEALNRISLKVKKVGSPVDISVRILSDKNGKPDKNNVLATGVLSSSLAASEYGWIEVTFGTTPGLSSDLTYWILLDTSLDNNNYWFWENDLALGYSRGSAKWSDDWQKGNPEWNDVTGDLSFQIFMGGQPNSVEAEQAFSVGGDVHAHTVKNLNITGDVYYQTLINTTAANYVPISDDPAPKTFPISDANVEDWKDQAESNGIIGGDISDCVSILESKKIVGNITFGSNCIVTVKSPVWITGNLTINSNNNLKLSSEYGVTSGVIIVDGIIELGSNNKLEGTGQGSSLLMALSNYDSRINDISAIKITNTGNSGVFYANKGIIEPGNRNKFKELTAWKIKLVNNGEINYESGLSSTLFTSGPSGSYSLVKGSYQVQ